MPEYRRDRAPDGMFFLTLNLRDRRSDLLMIATRIPPVDRVALA
jgi:hypothetical protein